MDGEKLKALVKEIHSKYRFDRYVELSGKSIDDIRASEVFKLWYAEESSSICYTTVGQMVKSYIGYGLHDKEFEEKVVQLRDSLKEEFDKLTTRSGGINYE